MSDIFTKSGYGVYYCETILLALHLILIKNYIS